MHYTPDALRNLGINPDGLLFFKDKIPYDPTLNSFSRELRIDGVKAEAYMWKILKNKKTGYRFLRQKPILHYIADFYCEELNIVVEIDGSSHNIEEVQRHDQQRDKDMTALGLKVVRLWDYDVIKTPLASACRIFHEAGVPIPASLSGLHDGSERLWNPFG